MKDRLNSIRFRSWLTFVLFSLIVIVFLYFFQVMLLSSYYEYMKIQETASAAKQIKDAWSQQPENLNSIVSDIADKQKIYIEISDSNRPYFRASSLDKSNKEVYSLITSLSPTDMKEIISGENTFFTATIPRTNNDSKAIVLIAQLDDGTESTFFKTNGIVRLYIFNYLEPLGTTTAILHSQLNLTAGIIIIVAFIMSIIFSNSISKPIINISKAALKLPQGQFDMPVKKNSFTEINELTDTLSSASVEIAKADTLRKDLMANISHDLRTPLTMIKAYAEMIRDLSGDNPEKREKHLQVIIDETDRLEALDQEGLLYDFSQDSYWVGREPAWQEPKGLFSADGRMIGIPYNPIITGEYEPDTILIFIVNAKSAHSKRALEYAKHFVKSYEWVYNVIETGWSDPDIEKKYGEHSICIYKDEVDW